MYKDDQKSEKIIHEDSLLLFDYIVNELKYDPKKIIIVGRSIGTSLATYLAS